jgi:hypothetical protein
MEIKPERTQVGRATKKRKLFRRELLLPIDTPGLIGVRHQRREIHNKIRQIKTLTNCKLPHLLAASNRRELNPG